ncbi:MAG TPA: ATP-binding protein, partial [Ktedonobacteraceae bacterium]
QMGISLQNEIASETPLVMADSDRITQVLLNLLDNARRHTLKGGSITIRAYSKDNMLYTQIRDTGIGIDATDLPHIFERFYRANRSRNGASGGSGLGLSIVKAIITAHGGNIWAESEPGQGTVVTFTLPLVRT